MSGNLYGPANTALFDPPITRSPTKLSKPGGGGGASPYIWSWPGLLNYVADVFPEIVASDAVTLTVASVIQKRATAAMSFNVTVNGAVIDSFTVAATLQATDTISVSVTAGDRVCVVPTAVGAGTADIVTIQLLES